MAGFARESLRARYLETLQRALRSDDGREMAVDALSGLTAWRPELPAAPGTQPYPDLPTAPPTERDYSGIVFITARFRTGSTLLWNIFRHLDDRVAYYEPLNERRWFDPSVRGRGLDPTHRGVDDYWREYEGLEDLGDLYDEEWIRRGLYLDARAWEPRLKAYLDRLIDHARPKRAVLQCNRIDFRLPWIRAQFPCASIVHLYRHPRDQWCSSLITPRDVPTDLSLEAFGLHDHFYLAAWARDLKRHFPLLADTEASSAYRAFYLIWRLSYIFGAAYSDHQLSFEDLTASPSQAIADLLPEVTAAATRDRLAGLVGEPSIGAWKSYADGEWFRAHEAACEAMLGDFLKTSA